NQTISVKLLALSWSRFTVTNGSWLSNGLSGSSLSFHGFQSTISLKCVSISTTRYECGPTSDRLEGDFFVDNRTKCPALNCSASFPIHSSSSGRTAPAARLVIWGSTTLEEPPTIPSFRDSSFVSEPITAS